MIPDPWFPLTHHPVQSALWRTSARFVTVCAGRGSGKTELSRRRVVRMLPIKKQWTDPIYFYALPTAQQARRVAWGPIKKLVPKHWLAKQPNESEMKIETVFGSTLYVIGLDKPMRAEGVQWDGGVIDESSDVKPGTFDRTFLPAFSHRNAWCWRIGVPKRFGIGAKEFRSTFEKYLKDDDPLTAAFCWPSADILPPAALQWALDNLDAKDFREQYQASWEDIGGGIYFAFSREHNVTPKAEYDPNLPICVGSDFNVDPMCWTIGHRFDDGLAIFNEMFIRNTNTRATLDRLHAMFPRHTAGWEFYGDATGQSRKTSASETDYIQIRNDKRFHPKRVYYPRGNPRVVNRFASTNALLENARGERRLFIHPRCTNLICDLETRAYKPGSREPDDYADVGHMADALDYFVYRRFKIRIDVSQYDPEVYTSG